MDKFFRSWIIMVFSMLSVAAAPLAGVPPVMAQDHEHGHGQHEDAGHFWGDHDEEEEHHEHEGAHGGQFGDASDMYHYEVLLDENKDVRVYMYDGEAQPIPDISGMEVRWTLNPDSQAATSGVFQLSADKEYFILDLPPLTEDAVSIKVEAEKDGRWWPVEFLLPVE